MVAERHESGWGRTTPRPQAISAEGGCETFRHPIGCTHLGLFRFELRVLRRSSGEHGDGGWASLFYSLLWSIHSL